MNKTTRALALFAALQATFSDVHPFCDQVVQSSADSIGKSEPGWAGVKCCARHVVTYTAGQAAASLAVTRLLGYRIPAGPFLVGMGLNAVTHFAIDRRRGFKTLLRRAGKGGYLEHATAQRREGVVDESGPGTALFEMDQSAHRLIGVAASLLTTWLAVRSERR